MAVWNSSPNLAGKQLKSGEKIDRELKRLRFDVKQYDTQLKKLQRELALKNTELKKLKSCGACTCLGDRRRGPKTLQTAEVRDLGTFGNAASREIADKARLEIHGQRPASMTAGDRAAARKRVETGGQGKPESRAGSLRRSRTEFFQNGAHDGGADSSTALLAEKDRELARLHEELAHLRSENSALKQEAGKGAQQKKRDDENVQTLRELGRQVRELENELLKLREERHRLLSESEQLRTDVNSKETNLLRCETQLTKAERERNELSEAVRRLENRERELMEELNEHRRRASGTARSTELAVNGHGGSSRMHRWNSDLALTRGALVDGDTTPDSEHDRNPGDKRIGGHAHRGNGATSVNGYHPTPAMVLETHTRTRDCNPYCEVCRIYRSKLVKHADRKVGLMNGGTSTTTHFTAAPARADFEWSKTQLETLKSKQKTSGVDVPPMHYSGMTEFEMQRELDQCVDEQNKRKRLLQRYLNEIQAYGRTLADKDQEISKLKSTIRDFERDYECFRKNLSIKETNIVHLQRDLNAANAIKEKTEQSRTALVDENERLQQQLQKLFQDKTSIQHEFEQCVEEQDKQKRLLQRYLNEIQTYERLLGDKDREISKLKGTIRDLEHDYEGFRKNLAEQESNLLRLQRDLSTANAMKEKTELGKVVLVDDYKRLQQQYQKLHQDKAAMQRELELCIEEQDKQKRLLQRYLNEIQSYERLLADKEKERMDMLMQFQANAERVCQCGNSPPRM